LSGRWRAQTKSPTPCAGWVWAGRAAKGPPGAAGALAEVGRQRGVSARRVLQDADELDGVMSPAVPLPRYFTSILVDPCLTQTVVGDHGVACAVAAPRMGLDSSQSSEAASTDGSRWCRCGDRGHRRRIRVRMDSDHGRHVTDRNLTVPRSLL
jgi:hypothetical protein